MFALRARKRAYGGYSRRPDNSGCATTGVLERAMGRGGEEGGCAAARAEGRAKARPYSWLQVGGGLLFVGFAFFGGDGRERAKQAVDLTVGAGGEEQGGGWTRVGIIPKTESPQAVD